MNIKYRKRQLDNRANQIKQWVENELEMLQVEAEQIPEADQGAFFAERTEELHREAKRQLKSAQNQWGNEFYKNDPRIAPLRGALATFGLTIDDIGVASFHGTSTKANDKNESATINKMMKHLGRSEGNPVLGVFQKYLTGHPKGPAGAWMLNGGLQILNSGIVPGNRNADNVDKVMEQFEYILYPSRSIKTDGIKAVSYTHLDVYKRQVFDSSWNWAKQSLLSLYFEIIHGVLKNVDRELVAEAINLSLIHI